MVAENVTATEFSTSDITSEVKVAEVVALYEEGRSSVGVAKIITKTDDIEETSDKNVYIYPNPAKDVVKISSISGHSSIVIIYNVMGMKVDEIEMNSDNIEVNISDYERGIYFFNVEGEVVKVIKN